MQSSKWELYEYQRSRSVIELGPNHLHSIFLNFFSSVTADFNISSAIRWAIQDQWSSGVCFVIPQLICFAENIYWLSHEMKCITMGWKFYGISRSFHSFSAESVIRWDENRRSPRKTTWTPASRTWLNCFTCDPSWAGTHSSVMMSSLDRLRLASLTTRPWGPPWKF